MKGCMLKVLQECLVCNKGTISVDSWPRLGVLMEQEPSHVLCVLSGNSCDNGTDHSTPLGKSHS